MEKQRIDISQIKNLGKEEKPKVKPKEKTEQPRIPSISNELEKGFSDIGKQINSLPKLKMGKENNHQNRPSSFFTPQEEVKINKLKKWGLIISISLVAIFAISRIIVAIFN